MYLKSLKLVGFKSFADRTRLEFRPGVTVVVGPNGSGKSNLVDSLSWVLGTQSAKGLRTDRMEEVIFSGTAARPGLSRAEVTLVIDNEDRQMDIDLAEVSITRRLYRDGSSEYEMNGVPCRLLDIQDLLSDSGVGRSQHVIIGQGEIGRVLEASPEDQRAVIEEAAGILKHRRRKERAERRLERTGADLIRLNDLLGEIDRQMRPLRRQARAAEAYSELRGTVAGLRLYLGGRRVLELDRALTVATSERAWLVEQEAVDAPRMAALGESIEAAGTEFGAVSDELEALASAAARLETTSERLRRVAGVARERGRAAAGRQEQITERRRDLVSELEALDDALAEAGGTLGELELGEARSQERLRTLEAEERSLAAEAGLSPEGAAAALRGEIASQRADLERERSVVADVERRLRSLATRLSADLVAAEEAGAESRAADSEIAALQAGYDGAVAARVAQQSRWAEAESALAEARVVRAAAEARWEALAGDAGPPEIRSALGPVVSMLDVPEGLEAAVTAALGEWADAAALPDMAALQDAISTAKDGKWGPLSFVSAVSEAPVPARESPSGATALVDALGPGADAPLATRLLGDVVLVADWRTGWEVVSRHPALRAATEDGDLVTVSGARLGAGGAAIAARRDRAKREVDDSGEALARAASIHTSARRDFERTREAERAALEALEHAEGLLAVSTDAMARLRASAQAVEEEMRRLSARRGSALEAIDLASARMGDLLGRLSALEGDGEQMARARAALERRREQVARRKEEAREAWQEAAAELAALRERREMLGSRRGTIASELDARPPDPGAGAPQLAELERLALAAADVLAAKIADLRSAQASARASRESIAKRLESDRVEHSGLERALSRKRSRIAELGLVLAELRAEHKSVLESLRRDADAGPEEAVLAPKPDVGDERPLEEVLEEAAGRLSRMGPVNPLAAEEYAGLEERRDFLASQKDDVEESRQELGKVIESLEAEIAQRFDEAFAEVSAAYERYFEALFPGGRGRMRLVDGEEGPGVVIEAQPVGKRLSRMSLLSGGERSLAALAFLFAVFDARPSPFYVLDEVEAALDDTNLRRFLGIVGEFRKRAQLVIVTHQQQTMEAADVLYGVTLETGGSSQALRKEMRPEPALPLP